MTQRLLKTVYSDDRKARFQLVARDEGLFSFYHEIEDEEEPPYDGKYWSPRGFSGLYSSAEEAENEARRSIPSLRPQP